MAMMTSIAARLRLPIVFGMTIFLLVWSPSNEGFAAQTEQAAPLAVSNFDTSTEGWTTDADAVGAPLPRYQSSGGDPGGYVEATDSAQTVKWYWHAPAKFLGNKSAAYKQRLTFSQFDSFQVNPTNDADVVLVGAGMTLVYDTPMNPLGRWTRYNVPLDETAGWKKNTLQGAPPTAAQMKAVLGSLTDLRIRGDYIFGRDTCGLDSVILAGPEVKPLSFTYLPMVSSSR